MDQLPKTELGTKRRILSIDGGGLLGTFPAAFLAALEEHTEKPIGNYFDLIAGTSTGGIIAIGLGMGLSAKEILHIYKKHGSDIFGQGGHPKTRWIKTRLKSLRHVVRTKYDATPLREILTKVFEERRLGEATTRLIIPAWSPRTQSVYIYKTAHHERLRNDYKSKAVDAAMATASAPTYFPQHITENSVSLIDGGVWANNPITIAVVEAVTLLGWVPKSLHVLSLGCLHERYTLPHAGGWSRFNKKLIKLLMDGQTHNAMGIAKLLTEHEHEREAIYRIDHTVPYGDYKMDDSRMIEKLKGLGYERARDRLPAMQRVFLNEAAEPFTPYHTLSEGDKS